MLRILTLTLLAAAWGLLVPARTAARPPARPNIVFILADDMGYGDPGFNNPASKIATPNLDRLAAEGMRFTDAHAPASWCVPSRYGFMTGRYPLRRRLRWRREAVIRPGRVTVASLLKNNGYVTAMVGKWHLGFNGGPDYDFSKPLTGGPVDRGFDTYFGIPASLDIPPYYYIRNRRPVAPPTARIAASASPGWSPIQGAFWRAGRVAPGFRHVDVLPRLGREAIRLIQRHARRRSGKPLFLYVALTAPHTPWLPTPQFAGKSRVPLYGDFMMEVDDTVGRILRALDEAGMKKNTLVIFTSDNGPVWYPADVRRFHHSAAGPWRGMKADAWEGGHREPFVARWPGRIPAGTTSRQLICFTDMMATFAAAAGVRLPPGAGEDSVNVLPVLLGRDGGVPIRTELVLEETATVIRCGDWKLITHLGSGGFSKPRWVQPSPGGPRGQLYDLRRDPGERHNLWRKRPDAVERLSRRLAAYHAQTRFRH